MHMFPAVHLVHGGTLRLSNVHSLWNLYGTCSRRRAVMRAKLTTRLVRQIAPQSTVYEIWDTELSGFVLRVWPSSQASYYLVYRTLGGRKVRYRIGPMAALTVAQARDLAKQYAARVTAGEDLQATKQQARDTVQHAKLQTLGGFLE